MQISKASLMGNWQVNNEWYVAHPLTYRFWIIKGMKKTLMTPEMFSSVKRGKSGRFTHVAAGESDWWFEEKTILTSSEIGLLITLHIVTK